VASDRITIRVGSLLLTLTHQEALDLEQHLHEALRRYERGRESDADTTVDMAPPKPRRVTHFDGTTHPTCPHGYFSNLYCDKCPQPEGSEQCKTTRGPGS
jgi:hypothetical protein